MQPTATHCNPLQHSATHLQLSMREILETLQHTATHCNPLQHTASQCNTPAAQHERNTGNSESGLGDLCCATLSCFHPLCTLHTPPVLRCVAVWCSVLQCVAVCCSVLQCVAVRSMLRHFLLLSPSLHSSHPTCVVVCCSVLQRVLRCVATCVAVRCSVIYVAPLPLASALSALSTPPQCCSVMQVVEHVLQSVAV